MKLWMWRTVEVAGMVLAVCDTILLGLCWLLMQFVLAMVARGIWRTTDGWHGVVGAAAFALFTAVLWGFAVWCIAQYPLATFREWRTS